MFILQESHCFLGPLAINRPKPPECLGHIWSGRNILSPLLVDLQSIKHPSAQGSDRARQCHFFLFTTCFWFFLKRRLCSCSAFHGTSGLDTCSNSLNNKPAASGDVWNRSLTQTHTSRSPTGPHLHVASFTWAGHRAPETSRWTGVNLHEPLWSLWLDDRA